MSTEDQPSFTVVEIESMIRTALSGGRQKSAGAIKRHIRARYSNKTLINSRFNKALSNLIGRKVVVADGSRYYLS